MESDDNNPFNHLCPQQQGPGQVGPEQVGPVTESTPLSKSQQKKLRRKELWQEAKKTKRIKKKEANKANKLNKPKPEPKEGPKEPIINQKKRKEQYIQKIGEGTRVVIDLNFFKQMTEKQQNSLFKQLTHCHSSNRNADRPLNLSVTSATEEIQKILHQKYAANNWGIEIKDAHFIDSFAREQLVYLTGDAEETIETLQEDKVYVIGGIVDHNRLKKITYNYSLENNVQVRRFPLLGQEIALKTNAHLAVNHVFEVLLKVFNGDSWESAISQAIPTRKLQS